jgi:hypothetical protein
MNPLKMLLLVIVSAGLACSAFAIERNADTPAPAVERLAEANGAPGAAILAATAPVAKLGSPAAANYRLTSAAAAQYAAVDAGRLGARAASGAGGVTAPVAAARVSAAPGGSGFPAMPEPAEWMQLLCGLVVAGFIARRRTSLLAD